MIEVWYGTPNELRKAASKPTQSGAVKWARDHLQAMEKQAEKYDTTALDHIRSTREQLIQTTAIASGDRRVWQFPYLDVQFRIELRNP